MELSELSRNRKEVDVDFDGNKLRVVYNPNEFTQEALDMVRGGADGVYAVPLLSKLLVSWDLTVNGKPCLTNEAELRKLPIMLVGKVLADISASIAAEGKAIGSR